MRNRATLASSTWRVAGSCSKAAIFYMESQRCNSHFDSRRTDLLAKANVTKLNSASPTPANLKAFEI